MNQDELSALLERLIDRIDSNTTDEAEAAMVDDVADFLSPERFARERQEFFLKCPQIVGFSGELGAPGTFITRDVMDIPIVVARDKAGVLRAMVNACAHRGGRIADGCGSSPRLTCKIHGWTFNLDGSLFSRPMDKCFDSSGAQDRLTMLPVSERSGLIVVGARSDVSQDKVDRHLEEIESQFSGFSFRDMLTLDTRRFEVKANWKLVSALSYESYHFAVLHRDSIAQAFAANAVHDFFGRHSRWAFAQKGAEKLRELDRKDWPAAYPAVLSYNLFPGTVLIVSPGRDAQILRTEPGTSPGTSVVHMIGGYRLKDKRKEALEIFEFGVRAFETEDLSAAIASQQGLMAGREKIHIGRNEPVVQFWHRLWRESLEKNDA